MGIWHFNSSPPSYQINVFVSSLFACVFDFFAWARITSEVQDLNFWIQIFLRIVCESF